MLRPAWGASSQPSASTAARRRRTRAPAARPARTARTEAVVTISCARSRHITVLMASAAGASCYPPAVLAGLSAAPAAARLETCTPRQRSVEAISTFCREQWVYSDQQESSPKICRGTHDGSPAACVQSGRHRGEPLRVRNHRVMRQGAAPAAQHEDPHRDVAAAATGPAAAARGP